MPIGAFSPSPELRHDEPSGEQAEVSKPDSLLELYNDLRSSSIETEYSTEHEPVTERQVKFHLENAADVHAKLAALDGAKLVSRSYQTDCYVIPAGTQPTFHSEYVRLREESFQETKADTPVPDEPVVRLVHKSAAQKAAGVGEERIVHSTAMDIESAIKVLEAVAEKDLPERTVRKERTSFRYGGLVVNVDQGVQFTDVSGERGVLGVGSFLEIKENKSIVTADNLAKILGMSPDQEITEPYANLEFFTRRYAEPTRVETQPRVGEFDFVDLDPINNALTNQVDWKRVLKGISAGQAGAISRDPDQQQGLIDALHDKLSPLIAKIKEQDDKGMAIILANSGQAGGKIVGGIKLLHDVDGFVNYPRPKEFVSDYATFELRGLGHQQIYGDGVRVMLTVAKTRAGQVLFFPHKIYMTKSSQDDRGKGHKSNSPAGWIERHRSRS